MQNISEAHSAEHAFIGSLQKLMNKSVKVRKVNHNNNVNTVFIQASTLDSIMISQAQLEVNNLISEGRKIEQYSFESLGDAKLRFPGLRANEDRIKNRRGPIRVIEIENHDISACSMEHVKNLKDCDFFIVTRIARNGDEFEVDFLTGRRAKEYCIDLAHRMVSICNEVGANINTLESTIRKLKSSELKNTEKLKKLTRDKLNELEPVRVQNLTIYAREYNNLHNDSVVAFAADRINEPSSVVLLSNVDHSSDNSANIVIARNEATLANLDFGKLFRELCRDIGRGGGKPNFVTGMINKNQAKNILDLFVDRIQRTIGNQQVK